MKTQRKCSFILPFFLFLGISVLFLSVSSIWTSPLYRNRYGYDSSFFSMVGRGITEGRIPYRDFFDIKGPYLFFIEALGQFIVRGRTGVFLIQVLFLWASLILIWKIGRLYLSRGKTAGMLLVFLVGHIAMLWGGNTLEEYMLPLNLLVLYQTVIYLKAHSPDEKEMPFRLPLVTGICFGIMFFGKMTIAAPILGIFMAMLIFMAVQRNVRGLLRYVLYFMLGGMIAAVPVFAYFAWHHALPDMLFCVFKMAFLRATGGGQAFSIDWELKLTACFIGVLVGILHFPIRRQAGDESEDIPAGAGRNAGGHQRRRESADQTGRRKTLPMEICLILIVMSVITYAVLHFGEPWIYYFITAEPILVLSVVMLLSLYDPIFPFRSFREAVCLLMLTLYVGFFGYYGLDTVRIFLYEREDPYYDAYYHDAQDFAAMIPDDERDSVYSLNIDYAFYEETGILPCYKYLIFLRPFMEMNPSIRDDILDCFEKTPPGWVIVSTDLNTYLPDLSRLVSEKYHCVSGNSVGYLYKLGTEGEESVKNAGMIDEGGGYNTNFRGRTEQMKER